MLSQQTTENGFLNEWVPNMTEARERGLQLIYQSKRYRLLRKGRGTYPVQLREIVTAHNGDKFIVNKTFFKRGDVFSIRKDESVDIFGLSLQNDGRYRVYCIFPSIDPISGLTFKITEFAPHLFEQYADRTNSLKRGIPLICEFFDNNKCISQCDDFKRDGEKYPVMCTCSEGAIFGHEEKWKTIFITFIASNTMQSGMKGELNATYNPSVDFWSSVCNEVSNTNYIDGRIRNFFAKKVLEKR